MSNIVRNINLDDKDTLFYLLNVFHDVIHDYGPGSTPERWLLNQNLIRQFYPGRFTMLVPSIEEEGEAEAEEGDEGSPKKPRLETDVSIGGESAVVGLKRSRDILESVSTEELPKGQERRKVFPRAGPFIAKGTDKNAFRIELIPETKPEGMGITAETIEDARAISLTSSEILDFQAKKAVNIFLDALKNTLEFNAFNYMQQSMIDTGKSVFPEFDLSSIENCSYYDYVIVDFPQSNGWDEKNQKY